MILNLTKSQVKVLDKILWFHVNYRNFDGDDVDTFYKLREKFLRSAKKAKIKF